MLINEAGIRQLINLIGRGPYSYELKSLAADLERRLREGKARLAQLDASQNEQGDFTCIWCRQQFVLAKEKGRSRGTAIARTCPSCGSPN
jgi:hypothetical protein